MHMKDKLEHAKYLVNVSVMSSVLFSIANDEFREQFTFELSINPGKL